MKKKDCEKCPNYEEWDYDCCECFEKQLNEAIVENTVLESKLRESRKEFQDFLDDMERLAHS
jgi:hypothetical protein